MNSEDLDLNNKIRLTISYPDTRGNIITTTKHLSIELENVGFWQRIVIFFKNLFK
jgi:hypothetical protein